MTVGRVQSALYLPHSDGQLDYADSLSADPLFVLTAAIPEVSAHHAVSANKSEMQINQQLYFTHINQHKLLMKHRTQDWH